MHTRVKCKCEIKTWHNKFLFQKIIVEQFDPGRGFEDTTLSPYKSTPVWQKFIQVLNVSNKHWILVFRELFRQVSIISCLVTDGKYPQKVIRIIYHIANCHMSVLELRILLIQQQKNSVDCGIFAIAYAIEIFQSVENLSFNVTCSLRNIYHFQRPIKDICRYACNL